MCICLARLSAIAGSWSYTVFLEILLLLLLLLLLLFNFNPYFSTAKHKTFVCSVIVNLYDEVCGLYVKAFFLLWWIASLD